jgi:hypothetical protein
MKLLFITDKYVFVDKPENGFTNSMHNIIGSWECSNLGDYKHVFISKDKGDVWSVEEIDHVLMNEEYDFAFITPYDHFNCSYDVAATLGKRLIIGWWDALLAPLNDERVSPGDRWWEYANRGTVNVVFDHGRGEMYKNTWAFETPQDTRIFCPNDSIEEDIDVSLVGAINTRGDRVDLINHLRSNGINVWHGGGRANHDSVHPNMPVEEYANVHKRSKICLNPQVSHGHPGRKGRGFEIAACGKFMLVNNCHTLDGWFERGVHYVDYNREDIVIKVRYYLDHPEERKQIGKNIYEKYIDSFSPRVFWTRVLDLKVT